MKFTDYPLSPLILSQLENMNFKKPTDIQFKAIPYILNGEDVMAVAQTGTGKTAAFVIPVIQRLLNNKSKGIRCVVLVPTRELCEQIYQVFKEIGKNTPIKMMNLIGGVEQENQIKSLQSNVNVLVTTPGRMFDLYSQGYINFKSIETLVIDEADLMLTMGFQKDIEDILKIIPNKRQTLFFTATIDKKIKSLAYDVVRNAIRIQFSPKNPVSKNVFHSVMMVKMDDKRFFLENILNEYAESSIIVFVRTKVRADRVQKAMERVGVSVSIIHGSIDQKERFSILNDFRNGLNKVLVTTDVTSRGIDLPNVDYVINYDIPDNPENYVHRCGRTGRGNNKGKAISFCSENELELLKSIEEYTGDDIIEYELSPNDYSVILDDTNDVNSNWSKLIKDYNKENEDEW